MRYGRAEYDIASLIYDPYMDFTEQESAELLELYIELSGIELTPHIFAACAMQRLMQALGAFANIGYNQQKEWYLSLIPTGLRKLRQVAARVPSDSPLTDVAQWLLNVV
jgi:aminoglycoside/choline kinase family phosphotransferase